MDVGVNYPWFDYGWDFGVAPPGWRSGPEPNWMAEVDRDLQHFAALGISVVRWFILGDGLTYGSGEEAPRLDRAGRAIACRFDPPALGAESQRHFAALLERFERANRQSARRLALLPVLVDFKFCESAERALRSTEDAAPGAPAAAAWVKGGRADAIAEPARRRAFLDRALDPLLTISRRAAPDIIYAWEVINEPEWVTSGWHPRRRTHLPVDAASMRAFLTEAMARIRSAGFKATIGFARLETIARTRLYADVNQFHHYTGGSRRLGRHVFHARHPAIIGEFATSPARDRWRELTRTNQRVLNRLRLADRRGYPLALLWSFRGRDRHTAWTPQVEQDIECFTQGRHCPA